MTALCQSSYWTNLQPPAVTCQLPLRSSCACPGAARLQNVPVQCPPGPLSPSTFISKNCCRAGTSNVTATSKKSLDHPGPFEIKMRAGSRQTKIPPGSLQELWLKLKQHGKWLVWDYYFAYLKKSFYNKFPLGYNGIVNFVQFDKSATVTCVKNGFQRCLWTTIFNHLDQSGQSWWIHVRMSADDAA